MPAFTRPNNRGLFARSNALNRKYGLGAFADPATTTPNVGNPATAPTPGRPAGGVDYTALIANDPIFGQAKTDFGAADISDRGQLMAALRRAAINFGEEVDPDTLGIEDSDLRDYLRGAFDDATRSLIGKSNSEGLSMLSRLAKANKDSLRSIKSGLAARGMLQSGELGHALGEEALRFKQAGFDARQAQLENLAGGIGGYLGRVNERKRALAQAMTEAAARQAEQLGTTPAPTPSGDARGGGVLDGLDLNWQTDLDSLEEQWKRMLAVLTGRRQAI